MRTHLRGKDINMRERREKDGKDRKGKEGKGQKDKGGGNNI